MAFSETFIRRPVLSIVLSLAIVLAGGIAFFSLGVREYPSVDPPTVTVSTNYVGANAEVMESQITEPLEESINGIAGIRSMNSTSSDGRSNITVEFELSVDLEAATNDVRDRVSRVSRQLPPDCDPPQVSKSDADASPIIALSVRSDSRNLLELSRIGNDLFRERLQTIAGVSEVRIWGERKYSMRLLMDPEKLAAHGLTPVDVRNALARENVELPTGRIEGYTAELSIRTAGRLTTETEFNNLVIKETELGPIYFKDIGTATLAAENERTIMRGDKGVPMIGVALTPQAGANHVAIADEFYKRVEQIKKDLPADLQLGVALDTTKGIRNAITEVEETIFIAFGLVVLVVFFFLRDWRSTFIPAIAIPVSLISAFALMYAAGYSINILTLLGMVLATGLVVDDAIVVLENIYVKIEDGMEPMKAGFEGSREIFFAIISTTVTLAAVFLPIMFLQGLSGRLFREFGVVVAGSVLVSAFVSLTLTPMMSARMLRKTKKHSRFYEVTERFFTRLTNGYANSLGKFMKRRWVALLVMALAGGMIFFFGGDLGSELAPLEDKGRMTINTTGPEGVSFEYMDAFQQQVIAMVDTIPEKAGILAVTSPGFGGSGGANTGFVRMTLVDAKERDRTQMEIAAQISSMMRKLSGARAFVSQEQTIGGDRRGGLPVQYVLQAPDFERLKNAVPLFLEKARAEKRFRDVDVNLKFNKPEMRVEIDRDRAARLGVSVNDVAQTLQLYFSGQRMGFFILGGKQYQVIGQATRSNRDEPADLRSVYVRNNKGEMIQLDNLVRTSEQGNPPQLYRYNRYVSATISASLNDGYTMADGIEAMDAIAAETLDESFSTALTGPAKDFAESSSTLLYAFLLALALVYLILAAQFESFSDPLTIMLTVPLALAGAVLSLWLFGQTLNIFSNIGIIVLVGIVTKNGILIVEFANQRRRHGLGIREAVQEAAAARLRPILMTSLATALGALPIAMALGAASVSRVSMGIAIIGGLLFSLVLTLYVIPALYTYLAKRNVKPDETQS